MKHVISVSIGSSKRDHKVELDFKGEKIVVERVGTDGDIQKAIEIISSLDGKVDAFGMGGIDLYLRAGNKKYIIKDAIQIKNAAKITPMVDGSGLKSSLERNLPGYINDNIMPLKGKTAFILTAVDRYGMAEGFDEVGCSLILGDVMTALGFNIPIYSLKRLERIAGIIAPIACKLPFEMLYPTGKAQNKEENFAGKYDKYFEASDIIAGDFHYIRRYLPNDAKAKLIVTNTVTKEDVAWLRERNAGMLVTSTPNLSGRSFGTNVIEALAVAILKKNPDDIKDQDYLNVLEDIEFKPHVVYLNDTMAFKAQGVGK
ncbi:quinate 5-dehydrogenase [Lutispora saccharofermentans]|uniref:Quinate 5-dehydrogenase n=1 Tax=Lutispora saccharofermentans TaxID=3024236 RepID=A0ABT1NH53_9FIRM|nr:quinate 5-dehydrogenase [Lutispora saccharofermentans]MCQ1530564.1 quinate 5-dehydrogenase [Lutispora saccharofermentans]